MILIIANLLNKREPAAVRAEAEKPELLVGTSFYNLCEMRSGTRLAIIGWTQSMVSDPLRRRFYMI